MAIGTEADDSFVITEEGIMGCGLNIQLSNVEEAIEVDGLEGDDTFFIRSTADGVVTTVIGGLGSDTFNLLGDVTEPIVVMELEGRSGVINHSVSSADNAYDGLLAPGIELNVADADDGSGVVIEETGGATVVLEDVAGSLDSYEVSLPADGPLTDEVYVTVSAIRAGTEEEDADTVLVSTDGVNFSRSLVLCFDENNWADKQQVWVQAAHDEACEGERTVMVSHSVTSDNPDYCGLVIPNVEVTVVDDDQAGLIITQSAGDTTVHEGGDVDSYTVALTHAPAAGQTVTVALNHNSSELALGDGGGNPIETLTFTSADWNVPQVVNVTAVVDGIAENTERHTIRHVVTCTDAAFSVEDAVDLAVSVTDSNSAGVLITETDGGTRVVAGGSNDSYDMVLAGAPTADVTITVQNDGQTLVSSTDARFDADTSSVTFTAADWDTPVTIDVTANPDYEGTNDFVKTFPIQAHTVNTIQGPLIIEGGVGEGADRSLVKAVTLPSEDNIPLEMTGFDIDESTMTDTINVFNDTSVADGSQAEGQGRLSATTITGLGMGDDLTLNKGTEDQPEWVTYNGGITYNALEIVEVMLGTGDDAFSVTGTATGAITAVHGGGGDDTITVTAGGGFESPLVIYGDTSQDRSRYSSSADELSNNANVFDNDGNDIIDASASSGGVTIYGGEGDDTLIGSTAGDQIAGGTGDDLIRAVAGDDHVYGDSAFNIDLATWQTEVVTTGAIGNDEIHGDAGDDIIFGDHGLIEQTDGTLRVLETGNVLHIATLHAENGGDDVLYGGEGSDAVLGGYGSDVIHGDAGDDTIFGDNGEIVLNAPGIFSLVHSIDPESGGSDTIAAGDGANTVMGGTGSDDITAGSGSDAVFGDFGEIVFTDGIAQSYSTTDESLSTGGDDTIATGEGADIVFGGMGADNISAGDGDDTVFGDFGYVANNGLWVYATSDIATGAGDTIDAGAGADTVFGGAAADLIDGGDGSDNLLGDGGTAMFAGLDAPHLRLVKVFSTAPLFGGDDTLIGGSGDDILMGSAGSDDLSCGSGDDFGLGDSGQVTMGSVVRQAARFVPATSDEDLDNDSFDQDGSLVVEATALFTGDSDRIAGGEGNDILIGGFGNDAFTGSLDRDIMIGNYGRVIISDNQVQSVVRLAQYKLGFIADTMFAAYASPFETAQTDIMQSADIGGIHPAVTVARQAETGEPEDISHETASHVARAADAQLAGETDREFDLEALQTRAQRHIVRSGECVSIIIERLFGDVGTPGYQQGLELFRVLNPELINLDLIISGQVILLPEPGMLEKILNRDAGEQAPQGTPEAVNDANSTAPDMPLDILAGLMGWQTASKRRAAAAMDRQDFENLDRKHKNRRFIHWNDGRMC